jgi:hypothetical protein
MPLYIGSNALPIGASLGSISVPPSNIFVAIKFKVGDLYGGGVIFNVTGSIGNQTGLISALYDISGSTTTSQWGGGTYANAFRTGSAIGDGQANTDAIVAANPGNNNLAAALSNNYTNTDTGTGIYSDWYLPMFGIASYIGNNPGEFTLLTEVQSSIPTPYKLKTGVGYWTSTIAVDSNPWQPWVMDSGGNSLTVYQTDSYYVRPIRRF